MSGFSGIVRLGGASQQTGEGEQRIERMAAAIAFRGPDARNVWSQNGAYFCFSFLKTGPTPQNERQPYTVDGSVWLLGDVRLDGREEIILRQGQKGLELPKDVTDEELVLRVFRSEGERGVAALDGDYSFVLWDTEKKSLLGFRDLTGSKPFFYSIEKDSISFSNTLDALPFAPGFTGALDENFLGDYLLAGWCWDEERTVYKQIRRLRPGHVLEFAGAELRVQRAAQLPIEELLLYKRAEDYLEHYRDLLQRAVKDRLPNDPCAIFLSGGLDSTSIAAVASQLARSKGKSATIHAQTVDYRPLFDDQEGEEARRVAEFLGIPLELLHGGEYEPFGGWDAERFPMPEPSHEPYQAFHVDSYNKVGAQARVALSGYGGDDILNGMAWPYLRQLAGKGKWMAAAGAVARHIWNTRRLPYLGLGIRSKILNQFRRKTESDCYPEWISGDFEEKIHLKERFKEFHRRPNSEHPTHTVSYAMLTGPFWPSVLEGEDAAWTGAAVETRTPLLDRRLVRYLLRLPSMPWCMDKHLMRRAMAGRLPPETLSRPKAPLAEDPVSLYLRTKQWKPQMPEKFSAIVSQMIDRGRLETCSHADQALSFLRPVTLDRWLKSVEMKRSIQVKS